MPTKKPAPRKADANAKKKPAARQPVVDAGEAAYLRLKPRLDAIPAARLGPPRAEVRTAASFVLSDTVPRLSDRKLRGRFLTLPAGEFDHRALDDLGDAAEAALWAQAELSQAEAGTPGSLLPVELVTAATQLRAEMIAVCEYHFRGDAKLRQQIEDIRSGQGYMDLAEDLRRLSTLYRAEKATLAKDLRFYRADDEKDALQLSQRITRELRTQGPQAARDLSWRTWALLVELYGEVARGAYFLLRDAAVAAFPSLHVTGRAAPRARAKTPNAPDARPTPPAP